MVGSVCSRFPSVVTAPSVELCGTRISGLVGRCCFSGVVCTTTASGVKASTGDGVLGLVTGELVVWGMADVKAGDIWDNLVLVAGRAGSVENPIKAGDQGVPGGRLTVTALVESVGGDTKLGDLASVLGSSCCGVLWFLGLAVWLLGTKATADITVNIWTEVTRGSLALCGTRVEDGCGKVVCETEYGARVDTIKETGEGDSEDAAVSEVDSSCCAGDPADGKADENGWGCDGGAEGTPESDGSSTGLVLVSRTEVLGILTVGV